MGFPDFNRLKLETLPHVQDCVTGDAKSDEVPWFVVGAFFDVMDIHPLQRTVAATGTGVVISLKNYFANTIPLCFRWTFGIPQVGICDSRPQD